jgi:ABC-type bacteriocin/lantibiotic exporter with double-glycine peptidase domain
MKKISVIVLAICSVLLILSCKSSKDNAYKNAYEIIYDDKKQVNIKNDNGNIKINNLTYYFNDKKKILNDIDLEIKEGEKVLITGKSGSGKSTLMKIIKKYYEIEYGKVKIGNIDVNDICKDDNLILYVSQNEVLFTDTLYNNLGLYNVDIDRIAKVLEECYIDEFIDKNLGCNMLIEENGFNISGGQKQRIILARALLQKFNILIVDEGTSQIDVNLERKILKNIFKNYKSKTMIFISHRLENMDLYDRVIELKEGRVIKDIRKCKT